LELIIDNRRNILYLQQLCLKKADNYKRLRDEANIISGDITASELREQILKR
jgi:hypothetical protein